jgi:threonine/homoserine/homoserine lactone efflux protein
VLAEAAGFAFLAAISPTALLVMAVFLSSAEPRRNALMYAAGAAAMTVTAAVAALFALRALTLNLPARHDPRYDLRLALGVLALAAAVLVSWRRRPGPKAAAVAAAEAKAGRNLVSRLTAQPSPRTAFTAGLVLFAPSITFLAAVQVIATSDTRPLVTLVGLLIVIVVCLVLVWLPLLGYLAAPAATTDTLNRCNGWLRAHGWEVTVWALVIGGVALVVNGALGLAGVL